MFIFTVTSKNILFLIYNTILYEEVERYKYTYVYF